jgi:hypothetical protein
MTVGEPYSEIKKVIAVSIIYFGLGKGDDYVYIGQTSFKGLHTHKDLELTKAQQEVLKKPTIKQAFPEYYLIQTTRFNDVVNEPLDEWIYFFKNNEVLDTFKAKGMSAVKEKLSVHNLPEEEKKRYNRFLDNLSWEASVAQTAKKEQEDAINEAREEEVRKGRERVINIAIKCIKRGDSNQEIMEITDLTNEEIEQLRKDTSSV